MKRIILFNIIYLVLFSLQLYAQKEGNIWYFGNHAGLDFNHNPPVALTDGQLNTFGGCASICNRNGQILFYTDGDTVWNKNHQLMFNGFGLKGNSEQAAIIVPCPEKSNLYYIFTNDGRLSYSIVDINKQGGLGAIISKNIPIHTPATGRLTAVLHSNHKDVWVIILEPPGKNSSSFYAFLVTSQGIGTSPVISQYVGITEDPCWGDLKASPTGSNLALAGCRDNVLFDFDTHSGIVSNGIILPEHNLVYGVEFSSDGTKLYGSSSDRQSIYQYDLKAGSPAAIIASRFAIGNTGNDDQNYAIQIGPDKKIYLTKEGGSSDYLGIINEPNKSGTACNFINKGMFLEGKKGEQGLPAFIQSYFMQNFIYTNSCLSDSVAFFVSDTTTISSVLWKFGDGKTSLIQNPVHAYDTSGIYNVTLITNSKNGESDTIINEIHVFPQAKANFSYNTVCVGSESVFSDFSSCDPVKWAWNFGDNSSIITTQNPTHIYASPGKYKVTLSSTWSNGFSDSIVQEITILGNKGNANFVWTSLCHSEFDLVDSSFGYPISWKWSSKDNPNFSGQGSLQYPTYKFIKDTAVITLVINFDNGCPQDSVTKIIIRPKWPDIIIENACLDSSASFSIGWKKTKISAALWNVLDQDFNGLIEGRDIQQLFRFSSAGTYNVSCWVSYDTDNGTCFEDFEDSIIVAPKPFLTVNNSTICIGNSAILSATSGLTFYTWSPANSLNNETLYNATTKNLQLTTTFTVTAYLNKGCNNTAISTVSVLNSMEVDAGPDQTITMGKSIQLSPTGGTNYSWSPYYELNCSNCKNPVASPLITTNYFVKAIDKNGCDETDSVLIKVEPFCGELFVPDAFSPNNDEDNDILYVRADPICIKKISFIIYNRWGQKVFESNDITKGWDGSLSLSGDVTAVKINPNIFFYTVDVTFSNNMNPLMKKGSFSLIR